MTNTNKSSESNKNDSIGNKMLKNIKIAFFCFLLLFVILTIVHCFPIYQGDGELGQNRKLSFYPIYEIYFTPFPLKAGKITMNYHFRGVESGNLTTRLYVLSESNQQIRFRGDQPSPYFLDDLKIAIELRENGQEVLDLPQVGLIFGGTLYYLATHHQHLVIPFSSTATYDLKIMLKVPKNPPIPLRMQFSLSHGHGCPIQGCKEVGWEDLLKK
ncbi:hypothetical protein [Oscillatoria sp. FACHB-1406]|uniref:hypothetical protein n=1 Tax=Oscillatoria sp. FACHB-1406 TaxID=2692846 RepID=UPI001688ECAB|nr:hypothetical protein [Oscillatoria sp. FACHB-1406]MBD2578793.1 hypothetical protein [Oscillatoria sp. FACHB-1406]